MLRKVLANAAGHLSMAKNHKNIQQNPDYHQNITVPGTLIIMNDATTDVMLS